MQSVRIWLEQLGLAQYADVFDANAITPALAAELSEQDLKEMGIAALGHRKILLKAIDALCAPAKDGVLPAPTNAERRQLTIVFCDLVGSTALSQQLDPERLRTLMQDYQQACRQVIERYDGHVAQYLGDGLMVYYGWPRAHEDDAERAVRSALELVDAVKRVKAPSALQVRIGISTGPVVVGETGAGDASVPKVAVGETPNVAARLQSLAAADQIIISASTRRLLGQLVDLTQLGAHALKGIVEPVQAWRVNALRVSKDRFEALRGALALTDYVGREEEIALMSRRWHQALEGEGQVVLLCGEPGIGKSRITQELLARISPSARLQVTLQCSPYHSSSAFYPVIVQMEQAAGFSREDSPAARLDKLENWMQAHGGADATALALFAGLLSLPVDRYPATQFSPQREKEELIKARVQQWLAMADDLPVLLVVEDAHWIDPSTLELLSVAVQRVPSARVMMIVTHRPEFDPPWKGLPHLTPLTLNRLGRRQTAQMVERVAGGSALPRELMDHILAKTEGIPLFAEELTEAVLESGVVRRKGDSYELVGSLGEWAIPSTLQDSLLARLDRLAAVKEVAQMAACIGREFSHELLAAVSALGDEELLHALRTLVKAELVFPSNGAYLFKHALVHEAAYQSLLISRRQQIHGQIAALLIDRYPEIVESVPETIAYHYSRADQPDSAAGYWIAAAQRALTRMAAPEAARLLEQALDANAKLERDDARDLREIDIRQMMATAHMFMGGWHSSRLKDVLEPARPLAAMVADPSRRIPLLRVLWLSSAMRLDYQVAQSVMDEILELAHNSDSLVDRIQAWSMECNQACWMGDFIRARAAVEQVLAHYDDSKHATLAFSQGWDPKCSVSTWGGYGLWVLGYPEQAKTASLRAIAHARKVKHGWNLIWSLHMASMAHLYSGEHSPTQAWLQEGYELALELALKPMAEIEHPFHEGHRLVASGDFEQGYALLMRAADLWRKVQWPHPLPQTYTLLAQALIALNRPAQGRALLAEALRIIETTGHRMHEAEVHRLDGELMLKEVPPKTEEAQAAFVRALTIARGQSAKSWELRAATSLAGLWRSQGRVKQAIDVLAPVYDWFTEGHGTRDLQLARRLLDELA